MEYTKVSGACSEWKKKMTAGGAIGAPPGQGASYHFSDDGMEPGGEMLDMHSSTSPTFDSALSRYETGFSILDGLQSTLEGEQQVSDTPDLNAPMKVDPSTSVDSGLKSPSFSPPLGKPSPLWEPWPSSYDGDLHTEELPSSSKGAMEKILDSADPGAGMGVFTLPMAPEHQKTTAGDEFCGLNVPFLNDQGLDGTFVSSFRTQKPSIVSSTEPEVQLLLVDVRQPPALLRENSAAPNGKERFRLPYDPISFRFPMSLPEAPPNVGFPFSPRLGSIPHEGTTAYDNKSDQDKCGDSQLRLSKVAKRHCRNGTVSPDNVPLRVPARMGRVAGGAPPAGLQSVQPFYLGSEGLVTAGLATTCLLCAGSNISPRWHSSLDENHTERCDQKLTENICSNVGRDQGGNKEVCRGSRMAENADMKVGSMEMAGARGGLYCGGGVEDYPDSA